MHFFAGLRLNARPGLDKCWLNKQIMFGHYKVHKSNGNGNDKGEGGGSGWRQQLQGKD